MNDIATILAILIVISATIFSVLGVVGLFRLPDVYTRLHATGKVGVLGVVLLLAAAALITPLAWGKALILMLFLLFAGPVTAHVLAAAAVALKVEMKDAVVNELDGLTPRAEEQPAGGQAPLEGAAP